jgi:hypothetical protein
VLEKGACWSVSVGNKIHVWNSPWIPSMPIFKATFSIISAGTCFIPRNNSSLPIWSASWISTSPSFKPISRLAYVPSNHALVIFDLIHSPIMSWKLNILHLLFDPTTTFEILKITIRSHSDSLLWTPSTTSVFSTKSTHHFISSLSPPAPSPLPKSCWKAL